MQGIKILHRNGIDIWKKNLKNGAIAILLVNRSLNESNFIELDFEEINVDHGNTIWDIYEKKEMNEMTNITVRLLPHNSEFLIINR